MHQVAAVLTIVLVSVVLAGCAPSAGGTSASRISTLLVSSEEARTHGWTASPDNGPVDGDSPDCTGAPFAWPKIKSVAHASQFLDSSDSDSDSVFVVAKEYDGPASPNIKALRRAIAPCAPPSGALEHGAIITRWGDDSFAYQSKGKDDTGSYVLDDTVIACGDYELEAEWISYSHSVSQSKLEDLLAPAVKRMLKAGNCSS